MLSKQMTDQGDEGVKQPMHLWEKYILSVICNYDQRVKVMYQEKAWCDQEIMKEWISIEPNGQILLNTQLVW